MKNRKSLLVVITLLLSTFIFAQSPEGFNYQAVIRDASNAILSNQSTGVQFRLIQGTPTGTVVYTETHNPTTDDYGLVSLTIGTGTTSDVFANINWGNGPYFLEIATDISGGTSYNVLGTQQLMSVPYALYAKSSGSSTSSSSITDADNDTKIQVEESADEDIIRFDLSGTEYFKMLAGRLEPQNNGRSVFIGENAGLNDDLTEHRNVFIGYNTGLTNITGNSNTAVGGEALLSNIGGDNNTALGYGSLAENIEGSQNTATGVNALNSNTTGNNNVANGDGALYNNTVGNNNTAVGRNALLFNTTGGQNTAIGNSSGVNSGNLSNTTTVGFSARATISNSLILGGNGSNAVNVGIGTSSPTELLTLVGTSGTDGILFPDNTLQTTAYTGGATTANQITDADNDTKIQVEETADEDVIRFDVAGTEQWKMVDRRLEPQNSGKSVFIGENAGSSQDTEENKNVFIGNLSGTLNIGGTKNVAIGSEALATGTSAYNNVALGYNVLNANNGNNNTAIGVEALSNIDGNFNTAIGNGTGRYINSGASNVLVGSYAGGASNTTSHDAYRNVMLGVNSGRFNQGDDNVFLGYQSGFNATGSNKLYIENSNSNTPLVYGEFDNDLLRVNGDFEVTGVLSGDGSGLTNLPSSADNLGDHIATQDLNLDNNNIINAGNVTATSFVGDGSGLSNINIDDADSDVTNELQNLSEVLTDGNDAGGFDITNAGTVTATSFVGDGSGLTNLPIGTVLQDLDGNTKIQVEETADEDVIRFDVAGIEVGKVGVDAKWDFIGQNSNLLIGGGNNGTGGSSNTFVGDFTGRANSSGISNIAIGARAMRFNASGSHNASVGADALFYNENGNENVALGTSAGYNNLGSGNVFIGEKAGFNEIGSNKLYVDNNQTNLPLIYGEFNNDLIRINGDFEVTGVLSGDGSGLTNLPLGTVLEDADGDTKIQVEETANEDVIRFDVAGTQQMVLKQNPSGFGQLELGGSSGNIFIGEGVGMSNVAGFNNTFIGQNAGNSNIAGYYNTYIGTSAGSNATGTGNVFLGWSAGWNELGDNKLHISNSSNLSLIYGEFDNNLVRINGDFDVTGTISGDGSGLTNVIQNTSVNNNATQGQNVSIDISQNLEVGGTVKTFGNVEIAVAPNSTVKIGNGGTALNNIIKVTKIVNFPNVPSNSAAYYNITGVTGAKPGATVYISPSADFPGSLYIGNVRVSANGTVRVQLLNEGSNGQDVGLMNYYITVIN